MVRGLDDGTSVEIVSGLQPGAQVVVDESESDASVKKHGLAQPHMGGMRHF